MLLGTIEKENKTLVIHFRKEKEKKKEEEEFIIVMELGLREKKLWCVSEWSMLKFMYWFM